MVANWVGVGVEVGLGVGVGVLTGRGGTVNDVGDDSYRKPLSVTTKATHLKEPVELSTLWSKTNIGERIKLNK
jgi:hypothetical protein